VSNGILVSNSLVSDIGFPIDDFIQDLCAKRIGKIQSTEYMLGASGGPAGLIPGLSVGITSASPTGVTLAEIVNLTKVVNAAYKTTEMKPCFLFNEATEATLMATTAVGSGERMFPEMSQGKLLKYPYFISNDLAGLTATSKAIVFGSIKAAATVRTTVPTLQVWNERFAEFGQTAYSMVVRSNISVVDANAAAILQLHA
jgi:HK97 family phage major capsid protein